MYEEFAVRTGRSGRSGVRFGAKLLRMRAAGRRPAAEGLQSGLRPRGFGMPGRGVGVGGKCGFGRLVCVVEGDGNCGWGAPGCVGWRWLGLRQRVLEIVAEESGACRAVRLGLVVERGRAPGIAGRRLFSLRTGGAFRAGDGTNRAAADHPPPPDCGTPVRVGEADPAGPADGQKRYFSCFTFSTSRWMSVQASSPKVVPTTSITLPAVMAPIVPHWRSDSPSQRPDRKPAA